MSKKYTSNYFIYVKTLNLIKREYYQTVEFFMK